MAKQTINPGVAPTGAGGDTFRSGSAKLQANDDEIYNYLGDGVNLNKLGTAAFKNAGTGAGNVMEVGAFGFGASTAQAKWDGAITPEISGVGSGFYLHGINSCLLFKSNYYRWGCLLRMPHHAGEGSPQFRRAAANESGLLESTYQTFYTTVNATVDANGFIKAASPIVKLFSNKVELNDEAQQQEIIFEKLGVGDYLIKGSTGFAQEGWYVETPKDANGNLLVAVVYEQLANGDISVKTYDYMLNKKGRIVADTETPLDIPESRWIDLRLQELLHPEIQIPESIAPPNFQPTGLAQAVATVMESYHDPEQ